LLDIFIQSGRTLSFPGGTTGLEQNKVVQFFLQLFDQCKKATLPVIDRTIGSVDTTELLKAITPHVFYSNKNGEASTSAQQDASEFFIKMTNLFLDAKKYKHMYMTWRSVLWCKTCNSKHVTNELGLIFQLKITDSNLDIQTYLNSFFFEEHLAPDTNCPRNCSNPDCHKSFRPFGDYPHFVHISLERFSDNGQQKLDYAVPVSPYIYFQFSESEEVYPVPASPADLIIYKIVAIICHTGSINGGHYTCWCQKGTYWYHFNSSDPKPASASKQSTDEVLASVAESGYVFLYRKAYEYKDNEKQYFDETWDVESDLKDYVKLMHTVWCEPNDDDEFEPQNN
jgi:ubiquitin C-terminal hydrolase